MSNAIHGSVTHSGTQVAFVPDADFHGIASFDYTVTDGLKTDTGRVVVTVTAVTIRRSPPPTPRRPTRTRR